MSESIPQLPPFPVDNQTLDLVWDAIHPDPEIFDSSSLFDTLRMLSELGGSDTEAVESEYVDDDPLGMGEQVTYAMMRDPQYHEHDLITALITEVRRLRALQTAGD